MFPPHGRLVTFVLISTGTRARLRLPEAIPDAADHLYPGLHQPQAPSLAL